MELRPVDKTDSRLLWEWRNDPVVRDGAFDQDPVEWEPHQTWLAEKLADPTCSMFIGEVAGEPIGVIRFDRKGHEVEVSVSVSKRGRGHGTELIKSGCALVDNAVLVANIKPDNIASHRAFMAAGFAPVRMERRSRENDLS